jgi:hypothetical protein
MVNIISNIIITSSLVLIMITMIQIIQQGSGPHGNLLALWFLIGSGHTPTWP